MCVRVSFEPDPSRAAAPFEGQIVLRRLKNSINTFNRRGRSVKRGQNSHTDLRHRGIYRNSTAFAETRARGVSELNDAEHSQKKTHREDGAAGRT